MNVPINEAIIITEINAVVTITPIITSTFNRKWLPKNNMEAKIIPFNKLKETSLINLLNKVPLKESFAKPCTIIADDCTQTFPAIAAISEVKKNKLPCRSIAPSNNPNTLTDINPPNSANTNHGNRALVCSIMLSSASIS